MTGTVFAVPVFFICFRESLETAIIVSVLLAFLKQSVGTNKPLHKRLVREVWIGVAVGVFICLIIGAAIIAAFYAADKNVFSKAEDLWEGIFGLIAAVIITIMGAALLRVNKMQDKWRGKIEKAMESRNNSLESSTSRLKRWSQKYAMFFLPFITALREGLEAVVFIGGVGLSYPAKAFPLPVITGFAAGSAIGVLIYKGCRTSSLQIFMVVSTCFLYLVGAGLFSKSVWSFENYQWGKAIGGDAAETGTGPGSYDIRQSVWHVNCCSPTYNGGGGWSIFNALFGWTNSATYGSVLSYNLYWIAVIIGLVVIRYQEIRGSHRTKDQPQLPIDVKAMEANPSFSDDSPRPQSKAGDV